MCGRHPTKRRGLRVYRGVPNARMIVLRDTTHEPCQLLNHSREKMCACVERVWCGVLCTSSARAMLTHVAPRSTSSLPAGRVVRGRRGRQACQLQFGKSCTRTSSTFPPSSPLQGALPHKTNGVECSIRVPPSGCSVGCTHSSESGLVSCTCDLRKPCRILRPLRVCHGHGVKTSSVGSRMQQTAKARTAASSFPDRQRARFCNYSRQTYF